MPHQKQMTSSLTAPLVLKRWPVSVLSDVKIKLSVTFSIETVAAAEAITSDTAANHHRNHIVLYEGL